MAGKFNAKFFNGEVFQKYIDRIPNPRKTELLKSRAIRGRPVLASASLMYGSSHVCFASTKRPAWPGSTARA